MFIKKICLVLWKSIFVLQDIIYINLSSFLALWVRFNMDLSAVPPEFIDAVLSVAVINTVGTVFIFALCKLYTSLWRYASTKELLFIIQACFGSLLLNMLGYSLMGQPIFRSYFVIYITSLFFLVGMSRFFFRFAKLFRPSNGRQRAARAMIIGAGEACSVVMNELEQSKNLNTKVCCIIDDDFRKHGTRIHGVKVVGGRERILQSAEKYKITEIIVAIPSISQKERQELLTICQQVANCELRVLPGVYQLVRNEFNVSKCRKVRIEDLLERNVVELTTEKIGRYMSGKSVLVTGGAGSIGSELCRQIAANGVRQLIIFDIYENNAYSLQQELKSTYSNLDLVVLIGSVRNGRKLNNIFAKYRPNLVYHAAAHKHVPLMEYSPNEAIKNNVFGTYNTALAAARYGAERFVLVSTDKAVKPTNIMGASKRICEMVMQLFNNRSNTEYVAVRFGNVLGSNGSVIPIFQRQIEAGGPVTVTHPDVTRYFMTIPEAVSLVLQAGADAKGGEIFVLDMGQAVRIKDLAEKLIRLSGFTPDVDIEIKYTGLRAGEKLYEELLIDAENLLRTENELIFIDKPIEFDENEFLLALERLHSAAYNESDSIKQLVRSIVSTYEIDLKCEPPPQAMLQQVEFADVGVDFQSDTLSDCMQKLESIS